MRGPLLRARDDLLLALCGADLGATWAGRPAPRWKSFRIRKGEELAFPGPPQGAWAYLAVAGGWGVEEVLGSKSTYLHGVLGGLQGRSLAQGDLLEAGTLPASQNPREGRGLASSEVPVYGRRAEARVVLGPQEEAFSQAALKTFLSGEYVVTAQSDRMGYRLQGPAIELQDRTEMLSDAVAPGSVQVLPSGQLIVMLADRQVTGGYPKIATVISTDLPKLAQLLPGGSASFRVLELDAAQDLAAAQERLLQTLQAGCGGR